ncbi:uncharacterized protein LOC117109136 [Anneissia japonica]|uniref:uncharacterized protein LOC117109136 n=1 Tax=Anneissia japonica TaxID=1529436 RepID=UPI00142570D9|nr:uncharacterized protein LOC117109136 [Anneissia japonica]
MNGGVCNVNRFYVESCSCPDGYSGEVCSNKDGFSTLVIIAIVLGAVGALIFVILLVVIVCIMIPSQRTNPVYDNRNVRTRGQPYKPRGKSNRQSEMMYSRSYFDQDQQVNLSIIKYNLLCTT